jgi:hypothetical protein
MRKLVAGRTLGYEPPSLQDAALKYVPLPDISPLETVASVCNQPGSMLLLVLADAAWRGGS